MANTKAPVESTYATKRVGFLSNPLQRSSSTTKDMRFVNCMIEEIENPVDKTKKYFIKSRSGLSTAYSNTAGTARGCYYWIYNGTGYIFSVIGNTVYVNGVSRLTLSTSTGNVGFCEHLNATNQVKLILLDGTKGYYWTDSITSVEITDVDFPTPHIPTPVVLDGYLFVAKAGTADIYNSNLNDPATWTAGAYITAEMFPDTLVALSRNNNFVYGIGKTSCEYFYDAANAVGTPLARQAPAVQQFGCAAQGTVVQTEKEVIFVGETQNGGYTVWTIDGFKEKEIGIPMVKSALLAEGTSLANATAFSVRVSQQKLYIICLTTRTLVYSFDTEMWSEWDSGATGGSVFVANYGTDGPNGSAYLLGRTSGITYLMDSTKLNDAGTNFQVTIVSQKMDFDTINRKFMYRFSIVGDVPDDTLTDQNVSIEWSDDDYKTWSTARTLKFNADLPSIFQLGNFRRRAFRIKYALPHLFRIEGIEVDLNKGIN